MGRLCYGLCVTAEINMSGYLKWLVITWCLKEKRATAATVLELVSITPPVHVNITYCKRILTEKSQKTVNHVALMETETQINKNMLISPVWPLTLWKGLSWMTQFTYTKTRKQTAGQSCWIKLQYTPASQAQQGYRKLLCTGNFM